MNRDRQGFFCLQLPANEAYGSTQWKMTHLPRSCVKTDDNCNRTLMDFDCLCQWNPVKTVTVISGTLWKYTLCHATLKKTNSFLTNAFKQPNKFTSLVSGHLAILSPSTTFLAEAKSKANAMSAVASDRIPGVFPTAILRSLAANKSIWLTPTPTLLITLRFGNKSMKSASILLCFEE